MLERRLGHERGCAETMECVITETRERRNAGSEEAKIARPRKREKKRQQVSAGVGKSMEELWITRV